MKYNVATMNTEVLAGYFLMQEFYNVEQCGSLVYMQFLMALV